MKLIFLLVTLAIIYLILKPSNKKKEKTPFMENKHKNDYESLTDLKEYPQDISDKIDKDFSTRSSQIKLEINQLLKRCEYCRHPRFLRCIVGYANSDLSKLRRAIDVCGIDTRDLIMLAEYENKPKSKDKPIRRKDYSKKFGGENL